jgi:predicted nucleic acid-binding protein
MVIFLDTSALYALSDRNDANHHEAVARFRRAADEGAEFVMHNLILVETVALVQKRKGHRAACDVISGVKNIRLEFIDRTLHQEVVEKYLHEGRNKVSLVDMFSFTFIRREKIGCALTFDKDFAQAGIGVYGEAEA